MGTRRGGAQGYLLHCPAGCRVGIVRGTEPAVQVVREHPAACPDPGYAYDLGDEGATIHPLVYAGRIGG